MGHGKTDLPLLKCDIQTYPRDTTLCNNKSFQRMFHYICFITLKFDMQPLTMYLCMHISLELHHLQGTGLLRHQKQAYSVHIIFVMLSNIRSHIKIK